MIQSTSSNEPLRLAFIRSVNRDGVFSKLEQTTLLDQANKDQSDPLFVDLVTRWQELQRQDPDSGLTATELESHTEQDPVLGNTWARLARDQFRLRHYFPRTEFGFSLMANANEANQFLDRHSSVLSPNEEILEYQRLISILSSDLFEGREAGTLGCERASRYLHDEIRDTLPHFEVQEEEVLIPETFSFEPDATGLKAGNISLQASFDVLQPYTFSGSAQDLTAETLTLDEHFDPQEQNLLPEQAKGKIVVFTPRYENDDFTFDTKLAAEKAFAAGAVGVIILTDLIEPQYFYWPQFFPEGQGDENRNTLLWLNEPMRRSILLEQATSYWDGTKSFALPGPVLYADMNDARVKEIFATIGDQDEITQITMSAKITRKWTRSQNIIASNGSNHHSVFLLTAHYDHLGKSKNPYQPASGIFPLSPEQIAVELTQRQKARFNQRSLFDDLQQPVMLPSLLEGETEEQLAASLSAYDFVKDSIFNGAVDNASGVCLVLVLARCLDKTQPLTLCFFTGEEKGLLGSTTLARSWPEIFPNQKLHALINLDMPGALDPAFPNTIHFRMRDPSGVLLEQLQSSFAAIQSPYHLNDSAYAEEYLEDRSDQAPFLEFEDAKILFFCGGFYSRYHAPGDDDQPHNLDFYKLRALNQGLQALIPKIAEQ